MGIWDRIRGSRESQATDPQVTELREQVRQADDTIELFTERLAELELALEDQGWQRLAGDNDAEFSRAGLTLMTRQARLYWLKNPLIKRAVAIQQTYVFGQGVNVKARAKAVNAVVQAFWDAPKNQAELTGHQAMAEKEAELQVHGNVFLTLHTMPASGAVVVRSIPFAEVDDVIADPEDAKTPWYYLRKRTAKRLNLATGNYTETPETTYHPDWRYRPTSKPATINGHTVRWDAPVYHVAVNKLGDMRFGVSELYAAIDWAKAYKDFLQDWATITRAYARFAWQLTTKGGRTGVAAAKTKLGTGMSYGHANENHPAPAAGSTFIGTEGVDMKPIRTAGATTTAEDGRRLLLMVCAATGIYEHYLGDPSTGNLATSTSMERPMELKFLERRRLWSTVLMNVLGYAVDQAAKAPRGALSAGAIVSIDDYGDEVVTLGPDPNEVDTEDAAEPMSRHIDVDFPALLDHDVTARIDALVKTTTLGGQAPAGTLDLKTFTQHALLELGVDDVDEVLEHLFPEGWEEQRAQDAADRAVLAQAAFKSQGQAQAEDGVAEAARALREALIGAYRVGAA